MTASAPGLVGADGAMPLWKSVLHTLAHRFAHSTRDDLLENTRCLERTSDSLRLAADRDALETWIRAGHVGAIESTLASLTDSSVSLALIPVSRVASLSADPAFTFETFVASPSNSAARERARSLAVDGGARGGSVALLGSAGAGKTHLLRAIAAARDAQNPSHTAHYGSAEALSLDLVNAISSGDVPSFRARLLGASALLVDDLQSLAGREATQLELLRSFDLLEARGVPIAITLARTPERTPGLTEALRARLSSFELVEVKPPEWETRVAIVLARIRRWGVEPKPEVASLLATRLRGNLGRLDAVLTRLMTQSSLGPGLEDVDLVKYLLSHDTDPQIRVTPEDVLNAVAQQFDVRMRDLRSTSRSPRVTTPRQIAMYLVRRHCGLSYPEIGRRFARHHTTALHSDRVIQGQLAENASLRAAVLLIEKELMRVSEEGG